MPSCSKSKGNSPIIATNSNGHSTYQPITQLYIVTFNYTGDDGDNFLEFAFMDEAKAASIRKRLEKLEQEDFVDRVYVGPVQNHTSGEHDIEESICEVVAQFADV